MSRRVVELSRDLIVWLIAGTAAVQTVLVAIIAFLHGEIRDGVVYVFGAALVFFLAHQVERVKAFLEA